MPGLGQQVLAEQEGPVVRRGRPFTKIRLHRLLTNVTYVGLVSYKGEVHPGEQPPLFDAGAFQRVGQVLAYNGPTLGLPGAQPAGGAAQRAVALWAVAASAGRRRAHRPSGGRRYRYYTCVTAQKRGWHTCPSKSIPAAEIEALVVEQVKEVGRDPALLHSVLEQARQQGQEQTAELEAEGHALEHDLARWQGELHLLSGQRCVPARTMERWCPGWRSCRSGSPWWSAACRRCGRRSGRCMRVYSTRAGRPRRWPCSSRCGRGWRRGSRRGCWACWSSAWTTTEVRGTVSITFHPAETALADELASREEGRAPHDDDIDDRA